jgi:hypothetical protein
MNAPLKHFRPTDEAPPVERLRHLAAQLHQLGHRATYELLREIREGANLWLRLERYAELDPVVVRLVGADQLPPVATLVPRRWQ